MIKEKHGDVTGDILMFLLYLMKSFEIFPTDIQQSNCLLLGDQWLELDPASSES